MILLSPKRRTILGSPIAEHFTEFVERSERYPLPVALATFAVALGYGTRRSHRQRWSERSPNSRLCSRAQPKEKFSLAVKESSELSIEHHWRGDCIKYH